MNVKTSVKCVSYTDDSQYVKSILEISLLREIMPILLCSYVFLCLL